MTRKAAKRGETLNPLFSSFEGLPECSAPSLYLASSINGVSKVGTTTRPFDRLKALQRDFIEKAGGPIEYFSFFEASGDQREEKALLKAMAKSFPVHCGREFFACDYQSANVVVGAVLDRIKLAAVQRYIKELDAENASYEKAIKENQELIAKLCVLGADQNHATFAFQPPPAVLACIQGSAA